MFTYWILICLFSRVTEQVNTEAPECQTKYTGFNVGNDEVISTPNFPEYYSNNLNCTWRFTSSDNGSYLVTFHSFNIYSSWGNDDTFSLKYKYGDTTGSYLSDLLMISPGTSVLVPGHEMRINFVSGPRFTQRGFLLQIERHALVGAFKVQMKRNDNKDRTIDVRYNPVECGDYTIQVKWSDQHVPGSPFLVKIVDTQEELSQVQKDFPTMTSRQNGHVENGWVEDI